jgi:hypothetical protein
LEGGDNFYAYPKDTTGWVDPFGLSACHKSKVREDRAGRWRDDKGRFAKHPGWPDDFGFEPGRDTIGALPIGRRIDRYGHPGGEFLADMGTPFDQRALPASSANKEFHAYEVVKPIPGVRTGPASPWFGQPGTGTQHQLPNSVAHYVDQGYLKEL